MTMFKSGGLLSEDLHVLEFVTPIGAQAVISEGVTEKMGTINFPSVVTTASLSFADGDTFKRFTVTDANVAADSIVSVAIRRADVEAVDDYGWVFVPNVVKVAAGSFDVNVAVFAENEPPLAAEFPNETVTLAYVLGAAA